MIIVIASLILPIATYLAATLLVRRILKRVPRHRALLLLACFAFLASWYLPSPLIDGDHTAFTTHLVGGGIFCGLLWLYFKKNGDWNAHPLVELGSLFVLTSSLGVISELFELVAVKAGVISLSLTDTSWDLAANTLGMLLFYLLYVPFRLSDRKRTLQQATDL